MFVVGAAGKVEAQAPAAQIFEHGARAGDQEVIVWRAAVAESLYPLPGNREEAVQKFLRRRRKMIDAGKVQQQFRLRLFVHHRVKRVLDVGNVGFVQDLVVGEFDDADIFFLRHRDRRNVFGHLGSPVSARTRCKEHARASHARQFPVSAPD